MQWAQILEQVLGLGVSSRCPLCQRLAPIVFCSDCQHQLRQCQLNRPDIVSGTGLVLAWGCYEGALKRAIAHLKYHHSPQIAAPFGEWLGQIWLNYHPAVGDRVVVPVPLHRDRQQQRGYNQAILIAQSFCRTTGLPLKPQGLRRTRNTQAQFKLSPPQRHHNLNHAFELGPDFKRRRPQVPVLLLDDIYTTGATVNSAATTLNTWGIAVQEVITVARTLN